MDHLNNHGLIIRELRTRASLSIQKAASMIGKSVGWLCEVENDRGTSRLNATEFDRIVEILGGSDQRHMFKTSPLTVLYSSGGNCAGEKKLKTTGVSLTSAA